MNKIIALILFFILLQLPIIFVQNNIELPPDVDSKIQNTGTVTDIQTLYTGNGTSLIENNSHGGSWFDSFMNDSGINWSQSNNVSRSNGSVKLKTFTGKNDSMLVGLWHFDESSGNAVYDSSVNKNDGTVSGTIRVAGISGNALRFDGINDYIEIPNNSSLNITNEFTVSAYINITPDTDYKIYGYRQILSKGAIFEKKYSDYAMGLSNSGALLFECSDSGKYYWQSYGNPISEGVWHHVAVTFNNGTIKYYLDGTYLGNLTIAQTKLTTSNEPLYIGARYNNPIKGPWAGDIDEVMIGTKAVSPENITGFLTTKPIEIPSNSRWDTLVFDKSMMINTSLYVRVLNAGDNTPVPGNFSFSNDGEFDISTIDPVKYPSLLLEANFEGNNMGLSSMLNYWGVSWISQNAWRDTFFEGENILECEGLTAGEGRITASNTNQLKGNFLKSSIIEIPDDTEYDILIFNGSTQNETYLNLTIFDANSNTTIPGFTGINSKQIDINSFDATGINKIWLLAQFNNSGVDPVILYDWSVNWTNTELPPPGNPSGCIDIDPDTLNLKSRGNWITCYIEPQDGSDPAEINVTTVLLNGSIPAEPRPTTLGDYDNDSLPDRMVKFNRSRVQELVSVGENVTLWVEGYYNDGSFFRCSDTIRVINPPDKKNDNEKKKQ